MNTEEFMKRYGLKNRKTVLKWLESGLVNGARKEDGQWSIPERAWPPYTGCRAKNSTAIYVSMIEACIKRRGVCAKLYNMNEEEFEVYVSNLEKEELITVVEENGAKYLYATTKSDGFVSDRKGLRRLIEKLEPVWKTLVQAAASAAAQAAVSAVTGGD